MRASLSRLLTRWFLFFALLPALLLGCVAFRYTLVTAEHLSSQLLGVVCREKAEAVEFWLEGTAARLAEEAVRCLPRAPDESGLRALKSALPGCRALVFATGGEEVNIVAAAGAPVAAAEVAAAVAALRASGWPRFFLFEPEEGEVRLILPWGGGFLMAAVEARPLESLLRPVEAAAPAARPAAAASPWEKLFGFHFGYRPRLPAPGVIKLFLLPREDVPGKTAPMSETATGAGEREQTPGEYRDRSGRKYLLTWQPLPGAGFVLAAEARREDLIREVTSQGFNMVFLAIFLVLILSFTLSTLVTRRITEPLRRLADEARRIAEGKFGSQISESPPGEIGLLVAAFNEMSRHLADSHARLREMAYRDELTGVYNRRFLLDRAREELARAQRTGRPLSLVMLDVDNFKSINDTFGHLTGDDVLREIAGVLRKCTRACDIVGRYGGDEFAIVLPETEAEGARSFCCRLSAALEEHFSPFPLLRVEASTGIASFRPGQALNCEQELLRLFREADAALLAAKQARPGR